MLIEEKEEEKKAGEWGREKPENEMIEMNLMAYFGR